MRRAPRILAGLAVLGVAAGVTAARPANPANAAEAMEPVSIPLSSYFDNDGIAGASARDGDFDGSGYTFPAEELPAGGRVTVSGVPYEFPDSAAGSANNVIARGQTVAVPRGRYAAAYLLYLTSLTRPGNQVVVSSPVPIKAGDTITMLGYRDPLQWTKRDGKLVIDVPAAARESGNHAWVFKIS
jgi:alpha-L-fucosidase